MHELINSEAITGTYVAAYLKARVIRGVQAIQGNTVLTTKIITLIESLKIQVRISVQLSPSLTLPVFTLFSQECLNLQ